MTLTNFSNPTEVGSKLFYRNVSGPRVVDGSKKQNIEGYEFKCYGAHFDKYPYPYLTMACAIGITKNEINIFCERLEKVLSDSK